MAKTTKDKILQEFKVVSKMELFDFLILKEVRKSRNAIKSLLAHKQIRVNGKLITLYNFQLDTGDHVQIMKYDQSRKEKRLKGLKIVFEDDDFIIVEKEAGILSVSTDREKQNTAYSVLNEYVKKQNKDNRIYVLHRLDREVSGLLIFTRNPDIQAQFQKNWDLLVPEYTFVGIVQGALPKEQDVIKSWLSENKNYVMLSSSFNNGGMESITHYKVIKSNSPYYLLEFNLETRRKNQIRVHMQQLGHPIVGDKKYGSQKNPIKRIALHAVKLTLKSPISGEVMEFRSSMPKTMQELMNREKPIDVKHE